MEFKARYNIARMESEIVDPTGPVPMISFFVDHCHPDVDANALFKAAFRFGSVSEVIANLLDQRFTSNHGPHTYGQRVFNIDLDPSDGYDFEVLATVSGNYGGFEVDPSTVMFDLYRDGGFVVRLGDLSNADLDIGRTQGPAL